MRSIVFFLLCSSLLYSIRTGTADRRELLCHRWRVFARKHAEGAAYLKKIPDGPGTPQEEYRTDGVFLNGVGNLTPDTGKWSLNAEGTEISIERLTFGGHRVFGNSPAPILSRVIRTLTADTLIYVQDHEANYFVRVK